MIPRKRVPNKAAKRNLKLKNGTHEWKIGVRWLKVLQHVDLLWQCGEPSLRVIRLMGTDVTDMVVPMVVKDWIEMKEDGTFVLMPKGEIEKKRLEAYKFRDFDRQMARDLLPLKKSGDSCPMSTSSPTDVGSGPGPDPEGEEIENGMELSPGEVELSERIASQLRK